MSDYKPKPARRIIVEQWKAACLAKRRKVLARRNYAPGWRRRWVLTKVSQVRWRLACWIAGRDLDDW